MRVPENYIYEVAISWDTIYNYRFGLNLFSGLALEFQLVFIKFESLFVNAFGMTTAILMVG